MYYIIFFFFYKMKVCVNTVEQICWCHFSNSICSVHVSVSHFGNSHNISDFLIVMGCHKPCSYKTVNLINAVCAQTVPLTCCGPPYSLRHNNIEIKPINNPTMACGCSGEGKGCASLIFKQKLEMIRLSKTGMMKAEAG